MFDGSTIIVDFLRVHQASLWLIGVLSVIVFLGTIVVIPILIIHIPTDYFTRRRKPLKSLPQGHAAIRLLGLALKNLIGIIFILSGIVMLVLPGQGVITLLIGLMLVNFPGKIELERRIIEQQSVLRVLNWIRLRARKPALKLPRKRPFSEKNKTA
ncbi:MAG: hypothetical protein AVO38_04585 [delta proteobacterium ML8_D]|nr:MAG: hypothetical protein AVO38_04585 [delta proteobacterium ML8_D]